MLLTSEWQSMPIKQDVMTIKQDLICITEQNLHHLEHCFVLKAKECMPENGLPHKILVNVK